MASDEWLVARKGGETAGREARSQRGEEAKRQRGKEAEKQGSFAVGAPQADVTQSNFKKANHPRIIWAEAKMVR